MGRGGGESMDPRSMFCPRLLSRALYVPELFTAMLWYPRLRAVVFPSDYARKVTVKLCKLEKLTRGPRSEEKVRLGRFPCSSNKRIIFHETTSPAFDLVFQHQKGR